MKQELEDKILNKYRGFFTEDVKIYTGDNIIETVNELLKQEEIVLPIQFGFECRDGWYMLLDELMGNIQNHIENYNRNADNKPKNKLIGDFIYWFRFKVNYKSIWRKWADVIWEKLPKGRPHIYFQIDQIKEKFGGLRFYYSGGDDYIDGMTSLAESLSYRICEYCGTTKEVGITKGWNITVCSTCREKNESVKSLNWIINP
jgi:hypothetical protein